MCIVGFLFLAVTYKACAGALSPSPSLCFSLSLPLSTTSFSLYFSSYQFFNKSRLLQNEEDFKKFAFSLVEISEEMVHWEFI